MEMNSWAKMDKKFMRLLKPSVFKKLPHRIPSANPSSSPRGLAPHVVTWLLSNIELFSSHKNQIKQAKFLIKIVKLLSHPILPLYQKQLKFVKMPSLMLTSRRLLYKSQQVQNSQIYAKFGV
jgi:hypothetical protein